MIAAVTILAAFPLGWFVRSWLAANTAYAIAYLWVFIFQTLFLVLNALGGDSNPAFEVGQFPWSYGLVTLAIFLTGFGLVGLGHRLRGGHTAKMRSTVRA